MKCLIKYNLLAVIATTLMFFSAQSFATSVTKMQTLNSTINAPKRPWAGSVLGYVWNDRNGNGVRNFGERGLKNVIVYVDANDNGIRDSDEVYAMTNRLGIYTLGDLPEGDHNIRQEVAFGWRNVSGGRGNEVSPTVIANPVNSEQQDLIAPRIIGGDETEIGEYPFMISVGVMSPLGFRHFCGGTLITDRWVATAAHCSVGANPAQLAVVAGTNNVQDGSGELLSVKEVYVHPDYAAFPSEPGAPFGTVAGYDIALWELSEPVDLRKSGLQSIAMLSPENAELAKVDTLATAVGWGTSNLSSNLLQDVHLPVYDDQSCHDVYFNAVNFETQICGGTPEGGIDACQGDSGGPLLVRDFKSKKWSLAGITSYGNGCALPGNPGVWARVSELSDWAKSVAVEPSRVHQVTVRNGRSYIAVFGNQETRYEPTQSIKPRWQLVNSTITNDPDQGLIFDYRILDESKRAREFECGADADGQGPLGPVTSNCVVGVNQIVAPPLTDGVYLPSLTAELNESNFSRNSTIIVGTPPETSATGQLTADDETDPDFPFAPFYIDYFDIANLSNEKAIVIRVDSTGFDGFIGLYDRDVREANGGGGVLNFFFSPFVGGTAELIFFPDPDINYLIGVSSFNPEEVGDYTVTLVNDGLAEPTVISSPVAGLTQHRTFRKLPTTRVIIPAPIQQ
ncbi:trypsin-like serine protease [Aliikangiella coralliicola]|uniref:Trypsin-like serine protease n=1 Tax=Aliikangiella coralliicola TaxID=2592383 RepID=A0A545UJ54_9GAMM|nr:trypsin-like serine protease [Aliikangiella coralliicola]TQV89497.1 trypsin-like serine protease [Aliikangiella coralliicola]